MAMEMGASPTWLRALALFALSSAACGVSPRVAHTGNAYFEYCHAADLDPTRSNEERRNCWAAWLEYYAEDQPVERQRYGRDRFASLVNDRALAELGVVEAALPAADDPATGSALPGEAAQPDATPVPADADEAPPTPASEVRPVEPPPPPPLAPPRSQAPPSACNDYCEPAWDTCVARCESRDRRGCVEACESEYRFCQGACP